MVVMMAFLREDAANVGCHLGWAVTGGVTWPPSSQDKYGAFRLLKRSLFEINYRKALLHSSDQGIWEPSRKQSDDGILGRSLSLLMG